MYLEYVQVFYSYNYGCELNALKHIEKCIEKVKKNAIKYALKMQKMRYKIHLKYGI